MMMASSSLCKEDDRSEKKQSSKRNKTIEERYQKKSQLEHILLRPDTYIGSTEKHQQTVWVWQHDRMLYKQIEYVPALFKIFDEILVNAADVKAREQEDRHQHPSKATSIKVTFDIQNKSISVWNDGDGIPIEIHKEHQIYVPELIFGHLLTSDNYDDFDRRVTGGRNGYGAKLTNIFSTHFHVECADMQRKRRFTCQWSNNMSTMKGSKIREYNGNTDFVCVTFKPDLSKFHMTEFEDDILSLLTKRVYDVAGTSGLKVFLNGKRLPIKDFKSYVDLYLKPPDQPLLTSSSLSENQRIPTGEDLSHNETTHLDLSTTTQPHQNFTESIIKIHEKNYRWEVVISASSDGQFQQVSFVNSICTPKGGTHVTHVTDPLVQAILKKVNAKNKKGMEIKPQHVKHHLWVFINCLIVNPSFDSQTKETLTTKITSFGSRFECSERTLSALVRSSIIENVILWAQTKEQVELKKKLKTGGGKGRNRILGIPKLEDANEAGGKRSAECTLILTEGDSAKTSCIAGLSVVGRDRFGVFPLKVWRTSAQSSPSTNVKIKRSRPS